MFKKLLIFLLSSLMIAVISCNFTPTGDSDDDDNATHGSISSSTSSNSSSSLSSETSSSTSSASVLVYFTETFESGNTDNWDLTPGTGAFAIVNDGTGNHVLQYTAGSTYGMVIGLIKDTAWATAAALAGGTLNDYYVEARIKPITNGTTHNKQLYLIGRYQDTNNFYLGGLNVQNANTSTKVDLGRNLAGTITRGSQVSKPIDMGTWYTVRFEIEGSILKSYLDGETCGTLSLTDFTTGKIGLFTDNKSFQIDDIKVGNTSDKPASMTLSPAMTSWTTNAGEAALNITVTATQTNGSADTFTALSDNTSAVTVNIADTVVTLTPIGEGSAVITFTSGSGKIRTITATVGPAFQPGTTIYNLTGVTLPAAAETSAYPDANLILTFDAPPSIVSTGMIRIYKSSDDSKVDEIKLASEINWLGVNYATQYRGINAAMVKVAGNNIVITSHNGKLDYSTQYYVQISNGTITGTIGGITFDGLCKAAGWTFTTKAAPSGATVTVDDNGTADFRTVQGALNHFMKYQGSGGTINVQDGTYEEALFLRNIPNVNLIGQSQTGTIIQYENYETLNSGSGASMAAVSTSASGGRSIFLIESCDLLTFQTLTLKSTHIKSGALSNQAEVLYYNGTGRLVAKNCTFSSAQDTLQTKGYNWFYNCLISGDVDFIWGSANVCLFESCEIRTIVDATDAAKGGYLVQSRSINGYAGYVFLNCSLTREASVPDGATYLARSGAAANYDNAAFINCLMDAHIAAVGWYNNPVPAAASVTRGWKEYGSTNLSSVALDLTGRLVTYSIILTAENVATFYPNRGTIFSGATDGVNTLSGYSGGWYPVP